MTIYSVPRPRPILTGPGKAEVLELAQTHMLVRIGQAGHYRLAIRYSPYWHATGACIAKDKDGMIRLDSTDPGRVLLQFKVDASRALATMVGSGPVHCAKPS